MLNKLKYQFVTAWSKPKIIWFVISIVISITIALAIYFKEINYVDENGNKIYLRNITLAADALLGLGITLVVFNLLAILFNYGFGRESFRRSKERKKQRLNFDLNEEKKKNSQSIESKIKIKNLEKQLEKLQETKKSKKEQNNMVFFILVFLGFLSIIIAIICAYN
ncbi:hypothetical protein MM26B8_03540 [Mycoplasmopsis meleagridis]|uniref:DUF3899 domain-containing protein n=1 Tax=Mycoplasmopsis meleagridis ATCC 25294 TaxID=1264554 RepID=A0A0F5H162_9BACT|nr:hypothetical protein [Mycoplasmopsis meleagridis]KKB26890.1 hypothetical protein MMELEA_04670 [Mycoplasmopsis meleagridis ATCC 25294]OAD18280.1 hypothetical protein MM26B8_03540 [Mycoplasmopsis meleagridis]VEU77546.1 Uncharacterised protein [Mycoplasmopsis meleagridis]